MALSDQNITLKVISLSIFFIFTIYFILFIFYITIYFILLNTGILAGNMATRSQTSKRSAQTKNSPTKTPNKTIQDKGQKSTNRNNEEESKNGIGKFVNVEKCLKSL